MLDPHKYFGYLLKQSYYIMNYFMHLLYLNNGIENRMHYFSPNLKTKNSRGVSMAVESYCTFSVLIIFSTFTHV